MEFFNSLTLDLKVVVVGLAGCALLAMLAGNQKTEKRAMIVFAVLAAVGVYRFTTLPGKDQAPKSVSKSPAPPSAPAEPKRKPLESTFAR